MPNLKNAKYKYENVLLFISIATTIAILYFFYDFNPLLTAVIVIFALFYIRLIQGQYLGNALQVSKKHFFRLKQIIEHQSELLKVKEPKLFIYQDPYPNAYTIGYKNPYSIVLSSSLVESLTEEELEAVICHELGHVRFNHSRISSIVSPAGKDIPFLTWIFSFWQRASELTADRVSLLTTENPRSLITALVKISIGPKFLEQIDEEELLNQSKEVQQTFLNKWGELLSNHPYLTRRIHNLLLWAKEEGLPYYKGGKMFCINCGTQISISVKFCPKCGFSIKRILLKNK